MSFASSVIINSQASPEWLEKCLWGFEHQDEDDFQVVIADHSATSETGDVVADFRRHNVLQIDHVHEEMPQQGRSIGHVLNQAVMQARGEYLIFTEGDCIPRSDFVHAHSMGARPGCFQIGDFARLPRCCSVQIDQAQIASGEAFDLFWLTGHGYPDYRNKLRLAAQGLWARLLNYVTRTRRNWDGHNSSAWKADIVAVNGFDERIKAYDDHCEIGLRLKNKGLRVRSVDYTAASVHLYPAQLHPSEAQLAFDQRILLATQLTCSHFTAHGISQH